MCFLDRSCTKSRYYRNLFLHLMRSPPLSQKDKLLKDGQPDRWAPAYASLTMDETMTVVHHILQQPLIVHIGAVLVLLWIATILHVNSPPIFILAFLFLYEADRRYIQKIRRQLRHEERRSAHQRRPLSDAETVQWLNVAIKKIWPVFLRRFSQEILVSLIPWFLDKYKPWTTRKAVLRHLDLGRNPPIFTAIRTIDHSIDDDHLVMDLGMDFLAAQDMSAVLAVQMRRRLGLGIWTSIHISKLQLEGKVRIAVKFSSTWPFLNRVRICFENAPYVQMTAKPVFHHGVDVTELPGIAGWMDRMMADALEQSLVEPNMLVIDVSRLVASLMDTSQSTSPSTGEWFHIHENVPIAYVRLEILEAVDLKPSDLNALSDPYIKGLLASYRFKTKIQRKTLRPKWQEEFNIPIASWDLPNFLVLHVRDKDQLRDGWLGHCKLSVAKFRGGQRHDIWLPLESVKTGRLHLAMTVLENNRSFKEGAPDIPGKQVNDESGPQSAIFGQPSENATCIDDGLLDTDSEPAHEGLTEQDEFEAVKLEKGECGSVSIMRPGFSVSKSWHRRRGKNRASFQRDFLGNITMDSALTNAHLHALDNDSSTTEEDESEILRTGSRKGRLWSWRTSHGTSPKDTEPVVSLPKDSDDGKGAYLKKRKGRRGARFAHGPEDAEEVLIMGHQGTAIRTKLESDHPDVGNESEQNSHIPAVNQETSACCSENPSKRTNMKNMTKNLFKHAGKKAQDLGHALTRKGSDHGKSSELNKEGNLLSSCEITRDDNQLSDENHLSDDHCLGPDTKNVLPGDTCEESKIDQRSV